MVETLIVAAIIATAILYTARRLYRLAKGKSKGCGKCDGGCGGS
jgi:hypothetical protein